MSNRTRIKTNSNTASIISTSTHHLKNFNKDQSSRADITNEESSIIVPKKVNIRKPSDSRPEIISFDSYRNNISEAPSHSQKKKQQPSQLNSQKKDPWRRGGQKLNESG